MITYHNMSSPGAFGTEWQVNGNRYQMLMLHGTSGLLFGVLPAGQSGWLTQPVYAPERFTHGKPVTSYAAFLTVVRRYVEEE